MLPGLTAEQVLRLLEVLPEQHFTQPPPRFTEASLVKTLEEHGIGRPSTYASIISTMLDRGYVRLEERRFFPEDVGMVVTDMLIEHFPDVVDVSFTAQMEDELDDIAEGGIGWTQVLHEFNGPFERALEKAEHSFERPEEELDELCPLCPEEGREPGKLAGQARPLRQVHRLPELPRVQVHPQHGRERAPEPELLDETCPECGAAAAGAGRPVRAVRRLQRLPRVQVHQEGPAGGDRRDVSRVPPGRAGRDARNASARRSTAATATPSARSR